VFSALISDVEKEEEAVLAKRFVANRQLFGFAYRLLQDEYFNNMPLRSGVLITGLTPTQKNCYRGKFSWDIDLLIIPFEDNDLVLSKILAVEIKVVRAKFSKQGKSPNDFGFSQASALKAHGFPYVAVAHFVVSDESPKESWRTVAVGQVTDAKNDRISDPIPVQADMLPSDLLARSMEDCSRIAATQILV